MLRESCPLPLDLVMLVEAYLRQLSIPSKLPRCFLLPCSALFCFAAVLMSSVLCCTALCV